MGSYDLEGIRIHVFSEVFHEGSDSTLIRVATYVDHLAKHIKFQRQVVLEQRRGASNTPGNAESDIGVWLSVMEAADAPRKEKARGRPRKTKISIYHTIAIGMVELEF